MHHHSCLPPTLRTRDTVGLQPTVHETRMLNEYVEDAAQSNYDCVKSLKGGASETAEDVIIIAGAARF